MFFTCTGTNPSVCRGVCGDGVVVTGEACDDGNTANGNGCSATCTVEIGFTCAGMPSVCTTSCGDGAKASTEGCDDGNVTAGDGCSASCTVELGWTCSGATPSVCVMRTPRCGDGFVDAPELCDDGNLLPFDGCSSNCRPDWTEVEPNEDGSPSTGGSGITGNDVNATAITNANNNGARLASQGSTGILATLSPAGDEDVFAITNDTSSSVTVRLDVWNRASGYGYNAVCGTSIDTGLRVLNSALTVLTSNDDRNGTVDRCSGASVALSPGQTIYAHVSEFGDDATVSAYGLSISFVRCGDGVVTAGVEACDDGNGASGDGCSATCTIEAGYQCSGTPSVCRAPESQCNDGVDNDGDSLSDCADADCAAGCGTFPACSAGQQLIVKNSGTLNLSIPDSTTPGVSSTITTTASGTIARLGIRVNITHTFDADLDMTLQRSSGAALDVSSDNGSLNDNYTNAVFDSTCATSVTAGAAPFTGCFAPEASFTSAYVGLSAASTWTFAVADDLTSDTGTLNNWSIMMCVTP